MFNITHLLQENEVDQNILDDFEEFLQDEAFILENFAKPPVELMMFINAAGSYGEHFERVYSLKETNVLHTRILEVSARIDEGFDIIGHEYDANYDSERNLSQDYEDFGCHQYHERRS